MKTTDIHKHICSTCNHVWIHDAYDSHDALELNEHHICPGGCGGYEIAKVYDSDTDNKPNEAEEAEVMRHYASLYKLKKKGTFSFFKDLIEFVKTKQGEQANG